jgi:UDP-N-acetylmuramoylalanine--D-glutamate ligase
MKGAMQLEGRRALVVGLARTGQAVARFLAARGARVTATEQREETALAAEAAALRQLGVEVECGGHRDASFLAADLIVPSPGVPLTLPALVKAKEKGTEVISELELAWRFLRGTVVAVTGSNGKTTTVTLLGRIFAEAGRRVQVGGNIGTPLISLVESAGDDTVHVVEVSSFQLEAVTSFRPRVAALLNITPDHLDRHSSMSDYVAAKARLFGFQQGDDFAIFNADDRYCSDLAPEVRAQRFWFSRQRRLDVGTFVENGWLCYRNGPVREPVLPRDEIRLKGQHNLENVLAAACAARVLEVAPERIRRAVAGFEGVEHRLEFVAEIEGVRWFNDSKATNVDAALKAIEAFDANLIVILGGKDKGSPYAPLAEPLRRRARHALAIGAARDKIAAEFAGVLPLERVETLHEAVLRAADLARPGDTVLLAPACASFDQFENFEHRGRVFKEEVRQLHVKRAS